MHRIHSRCSPRTAPRSKTCSCRSPGASFARPRYRFMPSTHPLWQLTITRFREFLREPEAVFWVFAFPVLLACALGLAFRSQGQPDVLAGVLSGDGAGEMERSLTSAG